MGRLGLSRSASQANLSSVAPPVPLKPPPKVGIDRITEMHAVRMAQGMGEANEVEIGEEGEVDDYARFVEQLLKVSDRCLCEPFVR